MSLNEALRNFNGCLKHLKLRILRICLQWRLNFLEILGRLSSTVNLSDEAEISSPSPTSEKSDKHESSPPQKEEAVRAATYHP